MVEITNLLRKSVVSALMLMTAGVGYAQMPVEARIAGLENNPKYMAFLNREAQLQTRDDSVRTAIKNLRVELSEDPQRRAVLEDEILRLEMMVFQLNREKSRLIDSINLIEQDWMLTHRNAMAEEVVNEDAVMEDYRTPVAQQHANLVYNPCFSKLLSAKDYANLKTAQEEEQKVVYYLERFQTNHETLSQLVEAYAAAQTEADALPIQERFEEMQRETDIVLDSLAGVWNKIYDNKNYAYFYLLDKMGKDEMMVQAEENLSRAMNKFATLRDYSAAEQVTDFLLRKRVMLNLEQSMARLFDLRAAQDSLQGAIQTISAVELVPPVVAFEERYFLEYEDVDFSQTPKYSYKNPIPECKVYAHGTIYRVLLGKFNTKRAASLFRGAFPLYYQINEDGKWCYYAGGFATKEAAEDAQKRLKTRGFLRPEIVMWTDSIARNITREPELTAVKYRVEIETSDALTEGVKKAIVEFGEGRELSRVGAEMFIIGLFDDRALAERLMTAIRDADQNLKINITEIPVKSE